MFLLYRLASQQEVITVTQRLIAESSRVAPEWEELGVLFLRGPPGTT